MSSHRRVPRAPLALVCVLALLLAACADGGADDPALGTGDAPTDEASGEPADTTEGVVEPGTDTFGVEVAGEPGTKPEITLPGGEPPTDLVVVDVVEGEGEVVPPGSTVTTQYVGVSWLNEGTQFDASWDNGGEPISFPLDRVIPGWTQGMPGMKVGGRRLLIIPPDLAYGPEPPSPDIAVDDTLVFVIDMVEFEGPPEPIEPGTDTLGVEVGGELDSAPEITLPGGEPPTELVVVDIVEGDGVEAPVGGTVTTHYRGLSWLNDGAQFDSSWEGGEAVTFPLDRVIPGWTQGIPGMKVGGRRLLIIPPDLAYGPEPPSPDIAPDDTLVFVIDLSDVQ